LSKIWTVVVVSKENVVDVSECWTHIGDSASEYQTVVEQCDPGSRVIAMIPGSHASGSKVYPFRSNIVKDTWIDPFDTPTESINE
jgi:hypothetical protein